MICPHCGDPECRLGWECQKAPQERPTERDVGRANPLNVGADSYVAPSAIIRRPNLVRIGKSTNIDHGTLITTAADIGDFCHVAPYVTVIGGARGTLQMGHFSTLGAGSRVVCADDSGYNGLTGPTIPDEAHATVRAAAVVLEPLAIVTTGCTLLPGVRIGMGALVGAGAVVTRDVPPWTVVAGVPARVVRERPREKILEAAKRLGYEFGGG
jgi:galactoside O-acetyltransferase